MSWSQVFNLQCYKGHCFEPESKAVQEPNEVLFKMTIFSGMESRLALCSMVCLTFYIKWESVLIFVGLTWNIFEKILYIIPILSHNVNYNSYWSDTCLLHLMWFCILSRELLVYICFVEKFHSPSYKTMLQPLYDHMPYHQDNSLVSCHNLCI